jgi:hypothetical protein
VKPRYNLCKYPLLGPFLGSSNAYLRTTKGQDPTGEPTAGGVAIGNVRRRSWTCGQKLGAIKYATSNYVPGKTGSDELIANNSAATNISCTLKMLHEWI